VGREFTAERETQNSGDPLTIRLSMRVDSKSLTTFFRDQGIYLSVALVIGATFWALGQPSLCWTGRRHQGGSRRHMAGQLYGL
jgi:hypothetical protein